MYNLLVSFSNCIHLFILLVRYQFFGTKTKRQTYKRIHTIVMKNGQD